MTTDDARDPRDPRDHAAADRSWHASAALLRHYAAGHLDPGAAWSVEQHVTACAACRAAVGAAAAPQLAGPSRLEAIWAEVEAVVDAPVPSPVERALRWAGVPDHTARLLAATPSLTLPWLLAVALVLAAAAAVAHLETAGPLLFLTITPLVPLVGVGVAFGRWSDPSHEIALATPVPAGRLLLVRAAAVTATSFALAALAALLLPGYGVLTAAWVLPGLAVTTTVLAVSTWWPPTTSAVAVGTTWIAGVLLVEVAAATSYATFTRVGQAVAAAAALVAAGIVQVRREALDRRRSA